MLQHYGTSVKIALVLNAFACMADFFIMSPILETLFWVFPDANMTLLGMILTISALTIIAASLLMHVLSRYISLKWIIVCGIAIVSVAGAVSGLSPTADFMIAMRLIEGFGAGLVIATCPAFIALLYSNEHERNKVMGWNGSMTALFGFGLTLSAGFLGTVSWQAPFLLYLIGLPILVVDIVLLPNIKPKQMAAEKIVRADGTMHARLTKGVVLVCVEAFVFAVMTSAFFIYISTYVVETGAGDSSVAGSIMSMETIAALPAGFILAFMMRRFRFQFATIAWLLMAFGRSLLQFLPNGLFFGLAAGLIFGIGYGLFYPYIFAKTAEQSDPNSQTLSEACATSSYYVGTFAATFVVLGVCSISGDFSSTFVMEFVLAVCVIMAAISAVAGIVRKHRASGNSISARKDDSTTGNSTTASTIQQVAS